jgi:hypothetical protein
LVEFLEYPLLVSLFPDSKVENKEDKDESVRRRLEQMIEGELGEI